jgi:siroheme synthase-like protein
VSGIPILVEGTAVRALVIGGGPVAARKARTLLDAGARVRIVASTIGDSVRALAGSEGLELAERDYLPADIGDAQLVIAATGDRAVNAVVAEAARAANRLVNVADAPAEGSFAAMATHRSGALVVAVSAGGVPGAAIRIRDAIAERFDARYARALGELATLRRALVERGDSATWRALAGEVISVDFCQSVERESLGERVAPWR